jgi:diacylglycerol kinase family enzyme
MRTLLIHNPTAGGAHPTAAELMSRLYAAGFSPRYQSSKDENYREALKQDWDLVVVAGGDGTVTRVARLLSDRTTPIAILPIGTANNIASALGLAGTVEELIAGLSAARPRRLDVGLAEGPWGQRRFLEAVGFGAIAKAISHSGPRPPRALRIDSGREELQKFVEDAEAERFEFSVDGEEFAGDFLLLEILNLKMTGPALPIVFAAAPDDGLLDIVFLLESERAQMSAWLKNPEHAPSPVTVRKGRKVNVDWKHSYARIDSRVYLPPKGSNPIKIRLENDGLRVLVPESPLPQQALP